MMYLLLLLAFELVTSDKLDRTYLPPPGAKLSGGSQDDLQTPLEYPKITNPEVSQYGQFPETYQDFNRLSYPSLSAKMSILSPEDQYLNYPNEFDQTITFPNRALENDLSSNPDKGLGSNAADAQQFDITLKTKPITETTSIINDFIDPVNNGEASPYYYYVPGTNTLRNNDIYQRLNLFDTGSEAIINPYRNEVMNIGPARLNFTPKISTAKNISQNYQPSVFGIYGGNPMIMTSQISQRKELESMVLSPKLNKYENDSPTIEVNQDKQNVNNTVVAHPFQTPLVGTNAQSAHNVTSSKYLPSDSDQIPFPRTTVNSKVTDNAPIVLEQRKNLPENTKIRYQRPQTETDKNAVIVNYQNILNPEGYTYSFQTTNGIHVHENGTESGGTKSSGFYSYVGDDGKIYTITYTADENGFQPKGDHLPTPPPIPEAIKKVIEQATKDETVGVFDDGSYDEKKYGHKNYQKQLKRYRPFSNNDTVNFVQRSSFNLPISTDVQKGSISNLKTTNSPEPNKSANNYFLTQKETQSFNQVRQPIVTYPRQEKTKYKSPPESSKYNSNIGKNNQKYQTVNPSNENEQPYYNDEISNRNVEQIKEKNKKTNPPLRSNELEENTNIVYKMMPLREQNQNLTSNIQTIDGFNLNQMAKNALKPNYENQNMYYNQEQRNQETQSPPDSNKPLASKYKTSYDNGYYYVPPIIKFEEENPLSQNSEQLTLKNIAFIKNNTPKYKNISTDVSTRTGLDSNNNQYLPVITSNRGTTRKPYVRGPKNQVRGNFNKNAQIGAINPTENRYQNIIPMYATNTDPSSYLFTTTPMPSQAKQYTEERNEPEIQYLNQYYETTIVPEDYQQILPNNVQSGENIIYRRPEISVSQNIVTSTYKPGIDGINLKVNQNFNIYDLRPTSENNIIKGDKVSTAYNRFNTPAPVTQEIKLTGYPDTTFQQNNNYSTNDNQYLTTNDPLIENGLNNFGVGNPLQFGTTSVSENPSFDTELTPTEGSYSDYQLSTKEVIGEDFSGPKQPQRFDAETGYYYK